MGDPKKLRKQYDTPMHPWKKERIDSEKILIREFGLKNKNELWRHTTSLKRYVTRYKETSNTAIAQNAQEHADLLAHMQKMGLIKAGASDDDVLGMQVHTILMRRLQTIVFKKKLAHSMKQARQFIVHRHIMIGDKVVTSPSFMVPLSMEDSVTFITRSPLYKEDHPERVQAKPSKKEAKIVEKPAEQVVEVEAQ